MQNCPTIFTIEKHKIQNKTEINRHTFRSNLDIYTFCYIQFKDLMLYLSKQQCTLFHRFMTHIACLLSPTLPFQHSKQERKLAIHYKLMFC